VPSSERKQSIDEQAMREGLPLADLERQRQALVCDFSIRLLSALLEKGFINIRWDRKVEPEEYESVKADFYNKFFRSIFPPEVPKVTIEPPTPSGNYYLDLYNSMTYESQLTGDEDPSGDYSEGFHRVFEIAQYYLHHDVPLPRDIRLISIEKVREEGTLTIEPSEFVYLFQEKANSPVKTKPLKVIRKSNESSGHLCIADAYANFSELRINMPGDERKLSLGTIFRRQIEEPVSPQFVLILSGTNINVMGDTRAYLDGLAMINSRLDTGKGEILVRDIYANSAKMFSNGSPIGQGNSHREIQLISVEHAKCEGNNFITNVSYADGQNGSLHNYPTTNR